MRFPRVSSSSCMHHKSQGTEAPIRFDCPHCFIQRSIIGSIERETDKQARRGQWCTGIDVSKARREGKYAVSYLQKGLYSHIVN